MILGILQARTSSFRLPRKVMLPLAGAPMLERQLERLRRAANIDRLLVATSDLLEDDCIAEVAESAGTPVFRGSLHDVLDRFYRAAEPHRPDYVVRLTADCPLSDWEVIDGCVEFTRSGGFDYASNTLNPTWPDGLDVEVFTFGALKAAWRDAADPLQREHVTLFIYRNPSRFQLGSFENEVDLGGLRWTVDEPPDYEFVSRVYERLYPANPAFTTLDVLSLIAAEPRLLEINSAFARNEGLRKTEEALARDKSA